MAENKVNDIEEQEEDEIIVLSDEDGKEIEFKYLATLDYEEEWYMYLEPIKEDSSAEEEDFELAIFHIESDADGNDVFVPVEDEELFDKLYDEFLKELEAQED